MPRPCMARRSLRDLRARGGTVVLAAIVCLSLIGPAEAGSATLNDPDDSFSRLDVATVSHRHKPPRAGRKLRLIHRITTHNAWRAALLNGNPSSIDLFIRTAADRQLDRRVVVRMSGGDLTARMINRHTGAVVGRPRAWHPDRRTIVISFGRKALGRRVSTYHWYATTTYHRSSSTRCGDVGSISVICWDRAPDRGFLEHRL